MINTNYDQVVFDMVKYNIDMLMNLLASKYRSGDLKWKAFKTLNDQIHDIWCCLPCAMMNRPGDSSLIMGRLSSATSIIYKACYPDCDI